MMKGDGTTGETGRWCSWCGEKAIHLIKEKNFVRRSVFVCSACGNDTVECRFCRNMARAGSKMPTTLEKETDKNKFRKTVTNYFVEHWDNELCAEHDGTIFDFRKAKDTINTPGDFKALMKARKRNLHAGAMKAGVIGAGAATAGVGAWIFGPGVAAALGTSGALGAAATGTPIGSLSGAALTSASLAKLGTGGLAVISAAGAGLGGRTGYSLATSYLKDIPDYEFIAKREVDEDHCVIFVNGFLSADDKDASDWVEGLSGRYQNSSWWYLNWEAKTLMELGRHLGLTAAERLTRSVLIGAMTSGSKILAKSAGRGGVVTGLLWLADNPWHSAMLNAEKAGVLLAEMIVRCEGKKFTLLGHSLGARVVHFALQALAGKAGPAKVTDAVLMGAAVGNTDVEDWEAACAAVSGRLYNCHSDNDDVLRYLYRGANLGLSRPAGLSASELKIVNLVELDFTPLVKGHNQWKKHLPSVLRRLNLGV